MTAATPSDPQALRAAADAVLELHETGELDRALAACDDLLAAAVDLDHPVVRESAFTARFERAAILTERGELEAAADAYLDAAVVLPFDRDDPDQRHELAMLLVNAGTCLAATGDAPAAVTVYDRLVRELGAADDPVTAELVLRGRVNRAVALLDVGRTDEVLAATDELAAELDPGDPVEAEQLGMVARLRATALRRGGRLDDAVAALAVAEQLVAVDDAGARAQAVAAQGERAQLLVELGRRDEAIALLDATAARFADDPEVAPVVGDLQLVEADLLEAAGQHDRAAQVRARVPA